MLPRDLSESGIVSVEDGRRGRYVTNDGCGVVYSVLLRPLGWRQPGETCLVARSGGALRRTKQYRLSVVDPISPAEHGRSRAPTYETIAAACPIDD